jgi:hypothetical protein
VYHTGKKKGNTNYVNAWRVTSINWTMWRSSGVINFILKEFNSLLVPSWHLTTSLKTYTRIFEKKQTKNRVNIYITKDTDCVYEWIKIVFFFKVDALKLNRNFSFEMFSRNKFLELHLKHNVERCSLNEIISIWLYIIIRRQ